MNNRYDMGSKPSPTYFGINRFLEETKKKEKKLLLEGDFENLELDPGTYMEDPVKSFF